MRACVPACVCVASGQLRPKPARADCSAEQSVGKPATRRVCALVRRREVPEPGCNTGTGSHAVRDRLKARDVVCTATGLASWAHCEPEPGKGRSTAVAGRGPHCGRACARITEATQPGPLLGASGLLPTSPAASSCPHTGADPRSVRTSSRGAAAGACWHRSAGRTASTAAEDCRAFVSGFARGFPDAASEAMHALNDCCEPFTCLLPSQQPSWCMTGNHAGRAAEPSMHSAC